jgi:hypothetical protein
LKNARGARLYVVVHSHSHRYWGSLPPGGPQGSRFEVKVNTFGLEKHIASQEFRTWSTDFIIRLKKLQMFTPMLPINSGLGPTVRPDAHRVARKVSITPRRIRAEPQHDGFQSNPSIEENRGDKRWPPRYDRRLHEAAMSARRAQETWFQDATRETSLREAQHRDALRFAREERERIVEQERDNQRRAWEQYHAQQRARLEEVEEQRRRALEEAERQRRESQRECAVCLDINDMGIMVVAPCMHWYCQIHLQGKRAAQTALNCCVTHGRCF